MSGAKLCIRCRHFRPVAPELRNMGFEKCAYTYPDKVNLVTGEPVYQYGTLSDSYCSVLRHSEDHTKCGASGQFFEEAVAQATEGA